MALLPPPADSVPRLREILQGLADQSGKAYLLVPESAGREFTSATPYGVPAELANDNERKRAVETITPRKST